MWPCNRTPDSNVRAGSVGEDRSQCYHSDTCVKAQTDTNGLRDRGWVEAEVKAGSKTKTLLSTYLMWLSI